MPPKSQGVDSNHSPSNYELEALPTELPWAVVLFGLNFAPEPAHDMLFRDPRWFRKTFYPRWLGLPASMVATCSVGHVNDLARLSLNTATTL